ncbi:MAG: type II secretion system secretin GspD [Rhodanobacteraceae bacterium]
MTHHLMDAMRPDESDASSARTPPACRLPAAGARSPWRPVATCLLAMLMVILAGCASTGPKSTAADDSIARQMVEPTLAQPPAPDTGPIDLNQGQNQPSEPVKPEIEVGSGKFFNEKVARSPTHGGEVPKGKVTFNFENQPIQAVVKAILGDLLEKNYIIAPGVNGNVSYSTAQPVRTEDAMPILETLLGWTNNTLIFKNGRYTVLPIKQAIPGNLTPRLAPAQVAKGYEVRIFPLHYISPSEMQKLLKPFAPADAFVSVDTSRSLMILAGTPSELINYQRTINTFDVDWLKGMSVGVYNMQNQDVGKLMPQLDEIFGTKGESPLAGMFRFVPIEATNSVIVITPQPEYLDKARDWLARLDAGAGGGEAGQQLYIYDVINMKAVDLADYLNQIFNGSAPRPSSDTGGSVAPGLTSIEVGGNRNGSNSNNTRRQQRRSTPTRSAAAVTPKDGGPRITAVEQNNQLLVLATATQWNTIQLAARRLDIQPLQVQIEAKILEVQLTGKFSFGVQWYLEGLIGKSGVSGTDGRAQPGNQQAWSLGNSGVTPSDSDTFFYSFINNNLQAAVHAVEGSGNTKILSAPSVVVTNNQEANIQVGDEIPVVQTFFQPGLGNFGNNTTGSNTGSVGNTNFNSGSVSFRKTGIQLQVTPRVNPGGLVYMDIDQEVSKPGATAGPTGNKAISQRTIQTQVAVQSGQTVLLGGLIQQNDSVSDSGVPLLSRIPWFGRLFGSTSRNNDRTELLILITPRVIRNSQEAAKVTREYQDRFESLKPLRAKLRQEQHSNHTNTPDGEEH